MKPLKTPVPAQFFCGLLFSNRTAYQGASSELEKRFGNIAHTSPEWPFDHTHYYDQEMGSGLARIFLLFSELVPQDSLIQAKLACRKIEEKFMTGRGRQVNIDPGLLTPERLVLATGKNFTHRIYLGEGVFAEVTLMATRSGFKPLEWTFPDYATPEIMGFWNRRRKEYLQRLKMAGML